MSIIRIGGTNRYSDIIKHENTIYLSGAVPSVDGSVYEQTKEVLSFIDSKLKLIGSSNKHILNMVIYLNDERSYDEMNRAFDEWIPDGCAPARATIGNVRFPNPMWKVEITVTAASALIKQNDSNVNFVI